MDSEDELEMKMNNQPNLPPLYLYNSNISPTPLAYTTPDLASNGQRPFFDDTRIQECQVHNYT